MKNHAKVVNEINEKLQNLETDLKFLFFSLLEGVPISVERDVSEPYLDKIMATLSESIANLDLLEDELEGKYESTDEA